MDQPFSVNDVFYDKNNRITYRILWISPDMSFLYIIPLDSKSGLPAKEDFNKLTEKFTEGLCEPADDPFVLPQNPSVKDQIHRDSIWAMLKEVLLDEPAIFDKKQRATLLKTVSEVNNIRIPNIYPLLRTYWKRGKTPDAFLASRHKQGGRGKKRPHSNPGAPRDDFATFGKILSDSDYVNFEEAIRKYYLTRDEQSLTKTFSNLIGDHYCTIDENGVSHYLPPGNLPSFRQFQYWYYSNYDVKEVNQKRKGETEHELTGRSILGKSDFGMMGPGSEFQVDATVADIYLVSQFDRTDIIGRPVMYFIMDVSSRMVAGMYVGLEGPSWPGMMEALYNASVDKVEFCHRHNIEITEDIWPCHHVPAVLLGDRGELESAKADGLVSTLGIRVDNAPPYRGDLKGIIESHFKTINTTVSPCVPGRVKPDFSKRGGPDYRLDATLDLFQFTQIIICCVIYYNNFKYLTHFEKSEQMMRSDVDSIPIRLWNWGISNLSGALRTFPEETIRLALLPKGKASVTEKGVKFKNILYSSPEIREGLWFEKARKKGSYSVFVSYDPRDLSRIYVRDPLTEKYILCELLDWLKKYEKKSLDEIEYEQSKRKLEEEKNKRMAGEAEINLKNMIDSIVEVAEGMSPSIEGLSKKERTSGIKQNRAAEKEIMRAEESFVSGKIDKAPLIKPHGPAVQTVSRGKDAETLSPLMQKIKKSVEDRNRDGS